jgi:hypothetical protein
MERREKGKDKDGKSIYKVYIISEEENVCPLCINDLEVIGIRDRGLIDGAGNKEMLVIRRLRCVHCKKIHHELPDILVPYKRHCAETIENVIAEENACCDFATEYKIKAWWSAFCLYFESIKISLQMKYRAVFSQNPTPREMIRAIANTNLWVHTRTAMTPI